MNLPNFSVGKRNGYNSSMNRLVVIDGNAIMHRAYHALPPLTTPNGEVVNVVYGFLSVIIKLHHDLQPTHMAVAFDRPGPTFRNKLFKEYQSQRPKMEDDFIRQIALVHDAVAAFGVPMYELDGYEADDMIGTIAKEATKKGSGIDQVIIVTGDRDILQLVCDDKVLVFMPTKGLSEGKLYGEKDVIERMGVPPKQIVDLKALMGDASDNYPGVPGIGPKTAIALLEEFGSFSAIISNLSRVKGDSVKAKLIHGKKTGELSKDLATIRTDAPIVFIASDAQIRTLDSASARKALESFHFPSLYKRLTGETLDVIGSKAPKKEVTRKKPEADQQQLF